MLAFYIAFGFQNVPIKWVSNVTFTLLVQFTDKTMFQTNGEKKKSALPHFPPVIKVALVKETVCI